MLASQSFFQLRLLEVAQTRTVHDVGSHLCVDKSLGVLDVQFVQTTRTLCAHDYLALVEVRLLEIDHCTVRECPFSVTEVSSLLLLHAASLGQFSDERFVLHIVYIGSNIFSHTCCNGRLHLCFSRHNNAVLFRIHSEEHKVRVGACRQSSHHLANHRRELLRAAELL